MFKVVEKTLVDTETGEVIGGVSPIFDGWKLKDYLDAEIKYLEPMTAQELEEDKLTAHILENQVVAEQKFDGHRGLIHIHMHGNRMFSRRISKETGWFSENTDRVPQIRDIKMPDEYYGTVIDGEILLPVKHCTCREVQSVTGALPETAIANQIERGFAYLSAFDCLYYKGVNIMRMPYWKRKMYLLDVVRKMNSDFVRFCPVYAIPEMYTALNIVTHGQLGDKLIKVKDYNELFIQFLKEDKEGLIIKNINAIYEQKRTKSFVKMKAHKTYDCVIMNYEEPSEAYDGKELKTWEYWMNTKTDKIVLGGHYGESDMTPVSKFYAMGWIGAIDFGVWKEGKLVQVGRASGMNEEVRKEISENKEKYLGTVIEVMAQGIINKDTGSLQHPRFIQFRPDKNSEQCTFADHIREEKKEDSDE